MECLGNEMLNPFTHDGLVIKTMKATLKEQRTEGLKGLTVCLIKRQAKRFKQAPFLKPTPFFSALRAISRGHKLGSHTAYQSVPHVQWSTKPPPAPHEIFIAQCRRKSCDVRDSSFGVLFLCGHSDTAAR